MTTKWIRPALSRHPRGWLHHHLGVPIEMRLPMVYLQAIVDTPIGKTAYNRTKWGSKSVHVTLAIKREANACLNARRAKNR
jgi:hypothetical protein